MRYLASLFCALLLLSIAQSEPVEIGGVLYDEIDPGDPFTAAPVPAQNWRPPSPTAAERAAGMLVFVAGDPGEYRPYRLPKPEEHVTSLQAALTPGEAEPVCFAIRTLAALQGLRVSVALPAGAPLSVDIRHMHCWPQRTGWRSRQFYITPELLLPCAEGRKLVPYKRGVLQEAPFDLPAEQTQGFWLTLQAHDNARPGLYKADVTLRSAQLPALHIPLDIRVWPFVLKRPPDRHWLLYCDAHLWRNMSDEQVLQLLRDFAAHGMNGLVSFPFGQPDLSRLKTEGRVSFDASPYRKYVALCQQAGLPGPFVIGSAGPHAVAEALGRNVDLQKGDWPTEIKAGVQAIARAAREATQGLPRWYYYGVDEPHGDNTYAIQDYQAWHDGGAPTYATFYMPSFLEKAAAFLTAPCFAVGLVSTEKNARLARETCEKYGAEFWWYGTGSYVNPFPQEGFMFHNRYGAGLLFWKTGARAEVSWTFCRPHQDMFNDFDGSRANSAEPKEQCTAYLQLLQPDDYSSFQGTIPTIAWEALREGVEDYCYLYTLSELIKQAAASPQPAAQRAAQAIGTELEGLISSIPWANPMGEPIFDTKRLQQVRHIAAERIVALQQTLAGQQAALPAAVAPQKLTLRLTTTARPPRQPLPQLELPSAPAAPLIDGHIRPDEWKGAACVKSFRHIRTGALSDIPTRAFLMADEQALYVAFDCAEPRMDALVAKESRHDGTVWLEDGVEVFVSGASAEPYAHLIVTTANVVLEERNQDTLAWEPQLQTAVGKRADGWSVEIALPWPELAKAGVRRAPLMRLNLCRNRYAGGASAAHTAWAATYDGFHKPSRFGFLLSPTAPVQLSGLQWPDFLWGRQTLTATLLNVSQEAVRAEIRLGRQHIQIPLAPRQRFTASFPLRLTQPGQAEIAFSWGLAGQPAAPALLPLEVPEPVSVSYNGGIFSPNSLVNVPVTLYLAEAEQQSYKLQLRLTQADKTQTREIAARPGQTLRWPLRLTGMARLQLALLHPVGRAVWESPAYSFIVLPD